MSAYDMTTRPIVSFDVFKRGRGWSYRIYQGSEWIVGDDGTRKRKHFRHVSPQYPSERQAHDALSAHLRELDMGISGTTRRDTVAERLSDWHAGHLDIKPSSRDSYAQVIRTMIVPHLGSLLLKDLRRTAVQRWIATLNETYAPRTIQRAHSILHQTLDEAVRQGVVTTNAADEVRLPRIEQQEMAYWTAAQAQAFLSVLDDEARALFRLMLSSGLRVGEALAIKWDDLDLDRRVFTLRRHGTRAQGRYVISQGSKRDRGRWLDLDHGSVEALRRWQSGQKAQQLRAHVWAGEGWVFTNAVGRHISDATVRNWHRRGVTAAGVPYIRPHDLRHTYATLSLAGGVPIKVVSERLGHARIAITLDLYAHVMPGMGRAAADLMDELYGTGTE